MINNSIKAKNKLKFTASERDAGGSSENTGNSSSRMFGSPRDHQVKVARRYTDQGLSLRRRRVLAKNYVRAFLERRGVFARIMSCLPIEVCVRLKVICSAKVIWSEASL